MKLGGHWTKEWTNFRINNWLIFEPAMNDDVSFWDDHRKTHNRKLPVPLQYFTARWLCPQLIDLNNQWYWLKKYPQNNSAERPQIWWIFISCHGCATIYQFVLAVGLLLVPLQVANLLDQGKKTFLVSETWWTQHGELFQNDNFRKWWLTRWFGVERVFNDVTENRRWPMGILNRR